MTTISHNLYMLRKSTGLSQAELAAYIGRSPSAISQYENGITTPSPETLRIIAATFGLSPSDLMERKTIKSFDSDRSEMLSLFDTLSDRDRRILLATARAMARENRDETA